MTTKHTPGPWFTCESSGRPWNVETGVGISIALAEQHKAVRDDPEQGSRTANAQLIAAAPDLADALADLMRDCALEGDDASVRFARARAALRKAGRIP